MQYPESVCRDGNTPIARPRLGTRLLCALALTIGVAAYSVPQAHAAAPAAASHAATHEGVLETQVEDDFKGKKSHTRHFLKTDAGERYELQFKKDPPQHASGSRVRVQGMQSGTMLALDSSTTTSTTTSYTYLAAPSTGVSTLGAQSTVVLLVNFQDQPANKPWTTSQVNSFVFGTVSDYFRENSYQQTWLTGQVYGWYTLPLNTTDPCDDNAIVTAANAAASAAGVNLSAFPRVVYMFPHNTCGWGGLATVGGNPSQALINGELSLRIVGHEIGHTLGLFHAHGNDCDVSPTGNTCTYYEYGDSMDIMGGAIGHFNAYQKERLGWLNYNVSPPITTVQSSGSYVIAPIESSGTAPKALKIYKNTEADGTKTYYYLEYRQPVGADYYFSTYSVYHPENLFGGVMVHTGNDTWGNSITMLDMTPGSLSGYVAADLEDPVLVVGRSYTDITAGITITPTWADSTGIGVDITLAKTTTCTRANPSVVMSPGQSSTVTAGTAVTYTVAVTNNDSSACNASTFSMQGSIPSGWTGTWAAPSLTISAGSASSTTFKATSSTSAVAGTYNIGTKTTNSGATAYSGSGAASYVIGTSTTTTTTKGKGRSK